MEELKKPCLANENLLLVHDLGEAMVEAKISLLQKLWKEIKGELQEKIPDVPEKSGDWGIDEEQTRNFVTNRRYFYPKLHFELDEQAQLVVEVDHCIYTGIYSKNKAIEEKYPGLTADLLGWNTANDYPLWRYSRQTKLNLRYPTRKDLALLADQEKRGKFVGEVVSDVRELWEKVKECRD